MDHSVWTEKAWRFIKHQSLGVFIFANFEFIF